MTSGGVDVVELSGLDQEGGDDQPEGSGQGSSASCQVRNPCVGPVTDLVGPDVVDVEVNLLLDTCEVRSPGFLESQPRCPPKRSNSYGAISKVLKGQHRDIVDVHGVGDAAFRLAPAVNPDAVGSGDHAHEGLDAVRTPSVDPIGHDG